MLRTIKDTIFCYRLWRAKDANAVRLWLRERDCNHSHVISEKPPVVYLAWERDDSALHEELKRHPLVVLYLFPWATTAEEIPGIAAKVKERLSRFPKHRVVFLCNEQFTVDLLHRAGVEALFCNQNAFISENVFFPDPKIPKSFDAVYNVSLSPYKRHFLARNISSLAIMAYSYAGTNTEAYGNEVRQILSHATWLLDTHTTEQKATHAQIREYYNRASVGLILSEVEGACFASVEYLLCGLPVVSTPSCGGRDVFWDDRFVIVCEPTPEAVAEAVQELKNRKIDPQLIRNATLERMEEHREALRRFLGPAVSKFECPWHPGSHGILDFQSLHRIGKRLAGM